MNKTIPLKIISAKRDDENQSQRWDGEKFQSRRRHAGGRNKVNLQNSSISHNDP